MPRLRNMGVRKPMILGFLGLIASQAILVSIPAKNYLLLLVATILEACSFPAANTLLSKLTVLVVDAKERARIMAILWVMVLVFTSPFGWIGGQMSEINRRLPFVLNIVLFGIGALLTHLASRSVNSETTIKTTAEEPALA